jgi:hypothetical protein
MANSPILASPPKDYEQRYFDQLLNVLRLYCREVNSLGPLYGTTLNLDVDKLPTDADVASLRPGDVYRDTTTGDVLKIKV